MLELTVLGCGDAFGAGGRLQTCFHVRRAGGVFLIDCGATAMIGMHRFGLDPDEVDTVVLSHLHGDHFSGLVWWLIHAHHVARRSRPMTIVGPQGTEQRLATASEALFPGSWKVPRRFELSFVEFAERQATVSGGLDITPFAGKHPSGSLSAALRIAVDGRILSFSGDTEWVEDLVGCAADADLFITECYAFEAGVPYHLNWQTLAANLGRLSAQRIMLSHMNPSMLAKRDAVTDPRVILAEDGKVLQI
ncbi:MAG TPA: MBL fold metallo-hydrolase [Hyphomicrobiaceae bacterium]|nr:MBL fold metallo-hydrolase [Hyphomicrobiaceae bacterium]